MLRPDFLHKGDKVALVSPAYHTPMENVTRTAELLRSWGLEPVVGAQVGKTWADVYAGTLQERTDDLLQAFRDPSVKAVLCNRGGYGTIQLVDRLPLEELSAHPKWLVGFSDITTLHAMLTSAGVMSLHASMSCFLSQDGTALSATLLRDVLMGTLPCYELPPHPQNLPGKAVGTLVGGNLMSLAPLVGSSADVTAREGIILFIEEVEESWHNIDRQLNMLRLTGALSRCRGVVLGDFTDCPRDLGLDSVEALVRLYIEPYGIPLLCGFPAGHGAVNLPLVMGAEVCLEVGPEGAGLSFSC